jgi:hypothetical protein
VTKLRLLVVLSILIAALSVVFVPVAGAGADDQACWGQATKVFAKTGEMGEHASQQTNPRDGLRNLARYLYERGDIEDDTMQALGAYVAEAWNLSIEACQ